MACAQLHSPEKLPEPVENWGGRGQDSTQEGKQGGRRTVVPWARLPIAQLHTTLSLDGRRASAAPGLHQHRPALGSIPAEARSSVPALTKTALKKTKRVERISTGQTQEYDVYPQSQGLRGLNPCIPLTTTAGGHGPSLLLH